MLTYPKNWKQFPSFTKALKTLYDAITFNDVKGPCTNDMIDKGTNTVHTFAHAFMHIVL